MFDQSIHQMLATTQKCRVVGYYTNIVASDQRKLIVKQNVGSNSYAHDCSYFTF
jgi:hypothetical protein